MSFTQTDITNFDNGEGQTKFPQDQGKKTGIAKCIFDVGTGKATGAYGLGLVIPKNSYVRKAFYKVITTFADGASDSATIALSVAGANDLTTATAISAGGNVWDASGLVACTPTDALSNEIAITADSEVTATVAVAPLTAGKLVVWVEWVWYGDCI